MFGIQPTKWGIGKALQNTKSRILFVFLHFQSTKYKKYKENTKR